MARRAPAEVRRIPRRAPIDVDAGEQAAQLVVLRGDAAVEGLQLGLVRGELRRQVEVLVLQLVEEHAHVEVLQRLLAAPR